MSEPDKVTSDHQKAIYNRFECQVKEFRDNKRLGDEKFNAELRKLESRLKTIKV